MYFLITIIRNFLYSIGIFRSIEFKNLYIICVGNLRVGGSGKTTMVEYLINNLQDDFPLAVVSLGYKRKTKGLREINDNDNQTTVGDEPWQMYEKYDKVKFFVCKKREDAIEYIQENYPKIKTIILDDAFQYRRLRASHSILLTEYERPFFEDYIIPYGRLRESRNQMKRCDDIIVTKCNEKITEQNKLNIIRKIKPKKYQNIYFSSIYYKQAYLNDDKKQTISLNGKNIIIVVGIDNPKPMIDYIKKETNIIDILQFKDHHNFNDNDIKKIMMCFSYHKDENAIILTTEKDATRLNKLNIPYYVLPIENKITTINNNEKEFLIRIQDGIRKNQTSK
jgi:tetraacyldisaccharide 4'-kinase